jgi:hypothetical protein
MFDLFLFLDSVKKKKENEKEGEEIVRPGVQGL